MPGLLDAKGHKKIDPPQDSIEVVARLPLTSGPVTHFVETQHYRRSYLYAEAGGGSTVTLIDVTEIGRPTLVSTLTLASGTTNVITAAGTTALVSESPAATPRPGNGQ